MHVKLLVFILVRVASVCSELSLSLSVCLSLSISLSADKTMEQIVTAWNGTLAPEQRDGDKK
jgi:hypothetical protein